jgi:ATP-dependent Clp protease ATP-binding subunit ClpA
MTNLKENKKQNNTIEERTEKFLDQQNQQLKNITNNFDKNVNEYEITTNEITNKDIDVAHKYQQETSNTIQSVSNNYVELQNNIVNAYQSALSKFIYNTSKSWNYFMNPARYTDIYNKSNQKVSNNTINATRINDFMLGYIETFNKSIEIAQKYYNDSVQYYFNFINNVERQYKH